jgi:hypothetical protein
MATHIIFPFPSPSIFCLLAATVFFFFRTIKVLYRQYLSSKGRYYFSFSLPLFILLLFPFFYIRRMRAYQVGPGSSRSTWKATLDPGKNLPCSNSGDQRPTARNDIKSPGEVGTNGQQLPQQPTHEQKK